MLEVVFYDQAGVELETHEDVHYVSLVNNDTYGPPPLIAPGREGKTVAEIGDCVLFINTSIVPAFTIERISD